MAVNNKPKDKVMAFMDKPLGQSKPKTTYSVKPAGQNLRIPDLEG